MLGQVFAQQPICVFVGAALPGTLGITEVHLDTSLDGEAHMLSHLFALVPCERAAQIGGQGGDALGQGDPHCFGAVSVGQLAQHDVAALTLDQRGNGSHLLAHDEISLPVARHRPIFHFGWAL